MVFFSIPQYFWCLYRHQCDLPEHFGKKEKKTKKIKTDLHEFPPEVANPDKVSIKSLSEEN